MFDNVCDLIGCIYLNHTGLVKFITVVYLYGNDFWYQNLHGYNKDKTKLLK